MSLVRLIYNCWVTVSLWLFGPRLLYCIMCVSGLVYRPVTASHQGFRTTRGRDQDQPKSAFSLLHRDAMHSSRKSCVKGDIIKETFIQIQLPCVGRPSPKRSTLLYIYIIVIYVYFNKNAFSVILP